MSPTTTFLFAKSNCAHIKSHDYLDLLNWRNLPTLIISPSYRTDVSDTVPHDDLRLPADALILFYLYANGQGQPLTIAASISRKANYVTQRISKLLDLELIARVECKSESGPVTLTSDGVEAAEHFVANDYILPEQRREIESATPYSVSWS